VGEGVGQGVGVGVRVILVFFGVWQRKRGAGGFFRFSIFLEGGSVAGQVFVLVCVKMKGYPPGVRVGWRCRCEAGVPCVACLLWIWS
jgi:hypothetical protein